MEWLIRMKDALDYMESKMEDSLNIDDIAKVAYSSPFHFQRMFYMLTWEYRSQTISVDGD